MTVCCEGVLAKTSGGVVAGADDILFVVMKNSSEDNLEDADQHRCVHQFFSLLRLFTINQCNWVLFSR